MVRFKLWGEKPADSGGAEQVASMTEAQLRDRVNRFSYRYAELVTEALDELTNQAPTPKLRRLAHEQKTALVNALLQITMGREPEANLLDMIVLATLARMVAEDHWVPSLWLAPLWRAMLIYRRAARENGAAPKRPLAR